MHTICMGLQMKMHSHRETMATIIANTVDLPLIHSRNSSGEWFFGFFDVFFLGFLKWSKCFRPSLCDLCVNEEIQLIKTNGKLHSLSFLGNDLVSIRISVFSINYQSQRAIMNLMWCHAAIQRHTF